MSKKKKKNVEEVKILVYDKGKRTDEFDKYMDTYKRTKKLNIKTK
jgi:hypothetical protein